jgi:hypothetical protein
MRKAKLRKLRRQADSYRDSQPKAAALVSLAIGLGRKKVTRGKEPTYESAEFPKLRPLSIPMHKGRDLPLGTKNSILSQLDDDFLAWDERLDSNLSHKDEGAKDE